jgi:hypothetical protein
VAETLEADQKALPRVAGARPSLDS